MTEAEWSRSTDPSAMVEFLRVSGRASDRRFRLYACACVRRVWPLLRDGRSRDAVEVAEQFIEGRASTEQVWAASVAAWDALDRDAPASMAAFVATTGGLIIPALAAWGTANAAAGSVATSCLVRLNAWHKGYVARDIGSAWAEGDVSQERNWEGFAAVRDADDEDEGQEREKAVQAALLRCIVGPLPSRPLPPVDASLMGWNNGTIPHLTGAASNERVLPEGTLDSARL
jgi:hypothetical protein